MAGSPREKICAPEERLVSRLGKNFGNGRDNACFFESIKRVYILLILVFTFLLLTRTVLLAI